MAATIFTHIFASKMAATDPALFRSCVLVGMNANSLGIETYRYKKVLADLEEKGLDKEARVLRDIGTPPWGAEETSSWADVLESYVPFEWVWGPIDRARVENAPMKAIEAEDYTIEELQDAFMKSLPASVKALSNDYYAFNAIQDVPQIDVPVFFVQGSLDFNTPSQFARSYYDQLNAPAGKNWLELKGHGHMVLYEAPEKFRDVLRQAAGK